MADDDRSEEAVLTSEEEEEAETSSVSSGSSSDDVKLESDDEDGGAARSRKRKGPTKTLSRKVTAKDKFDMSAAQSVLAGFPSAGALAATLLDSAGAVRKPRLLAASVTLHAHQQAALQWMVALFSRDMGGILADQMGLGKTLQAISLMAFQVGEGGCPGCVWAWVRAHVCFPLKCACVCMYVWRVCVSVCLCVCVCLATVSEFVAVRCRCAATAA
jgi:SNF2 family DNA or RNA helicase